ncbi:TrmB family transcriptional regulator [Candidatus Woesearchaeota archaeon]|nr:TrmB family transcriptional regulator [Candidatus Woesearchaeota archaeon]
MIVKEEFLNKLRQFFNLNLYEVRIWTALLSRGVSTAGELSDIGNVPRSRAYDVLESLEKKGFVVMKLGKPIKYLAVDPKEVVERVKKLVREEADHNIQKLKDLAETDVLVELNQLHKEGIEFVEPTDLSGAIRGRHNVYANLDMMLRNAQKSIILATTSKGVLRKLEAIGSTLEKMSKKNIKIRVAAPVTKETISAIKELQKYAEVRNFSKVDSRFCIVDGKEILFMITDDKEIHPTYDIGVWVNTPFFAQALEHLFNNHWKDLETANKVVVKS